MPRVIFKCPYLKGGAAQAAHLGNYVRYMATRKGAQRIAPDAAGLPATKKQREMVEQLIRDFPLSRGLFEYEDYIHFTEEQKLRAGSVDLVEFLRRQGEKLIRSGPEYRMTSDHSVTVRGNEWYDHATGEGGGPVSFVQNFYHLSYPEAVTRLLDGEQGQPYAPAQKPKEEPIREFIQPPANHSMRRLYAYLLKKRHIDREVLNTFVRAGLIYEDAEYHNAVFVGKDEHGVVRHAHKRSTNDLGKTFRINVAGSDPRYSFHWTGTSNRLYVFEAPIDLLSFVTLYPEGWQEHSYVACCGTSSQPVLQMMEQNPALREVFLCLDNDKAGHTACLRIAERVAEQFGIASDRLIPQNKDWNDDLAEITEAQALAPVTQQMG